MDILIVLNTLIFLIASIAWESKDFINLFVKIVLGIMFMANLLLLLKISGYIVKI